MIYQTQHSAVAFHWEVEYEGKRICESDGVLSVEQESRDERGMAVRLALTNRSARPVRLDFAYPVVTDRISIGENRRNEWKILRECRHKNDLPGSFRPSVRDDAYADAFNEVSEQGDIGESEAAAELEADGILVIAAPEESLAFSFRSAGGSLTEIRTKLESGSVVRVTAGCEFRITLMPGQTAKTEWTAVAASTDPYLLVDDYAAVLGRKRRDVWKEKPFVYSTWYYYGDLVDETDVEENLTEIVRQGLPFNVFQIDDGWSGRYGDWQANGKFPAGMAETAARIHDAGLIPGIWTCPFTVDFESRTAAEHPDWLLRDRDGELIRFRVMEDFAVLDLTNPAVLDWIRDLFKTLRAWGYRYHKLDFTRCAIMYPDAPRYDESVSVVEAYVRAMRIIREAIGEDGYLLICGGLYDPLIGICDAQRTGSDVRSAWLEEWSGRPKLPITVKQNSYRYYMNGWWHNDADALMVRRDPVGGKHPYLSAGTLTDDEAELFCANQYFSGGMVSSSERLSLIDRDRLLLLRHLYPILDTHVKPLGLFSGERYISRFLVTLPGRWVTLCALNWSDEEAPFEITVPDVDGKDSLLVATFFAGKWSAGHRPGETVSLGTLRPHAAEIVKIAPDDTDQIVASNMHYSMGGELTDGRTFRNPFDFTAVYTLRHPDGSTETFSVPGRNG